LKALGLTNLLRENLRLPNDKNMFEGKKSKPGLVELMSSFKESCLLAFKQYTRVNLLYSMWDIAYNKKIKFFLKYSSLGLLSAILYEVIKILRPFAEYIAMIVSDNNAPEYLKKFIEEEINLGLLGISKENEEAFKKTDQIINCYMVDLPLILLQLAAMLGYFGIPELQFNQEENEKANHNTDD